MLSRVETKSLLIGIALCLVPVCTHAQDTCWRAVGVRFDGTTTTGSCEDDPGAAIAAVTGSGYYSYSIFPCECPAPVVPDPIDTDAKSTVKPDEDIYTAVLIAQHKTNRTVKVFQRKKFEGRRKATDEVKKDFDAFSTSGSGSGNWTIKYFTIYKLSSL